MGLYSGNEVTDAFDALEAFSQEDIKAFEDLCACDDDLLPIGDMTWECPVCEKQFRFQAPCNLHIHESHPWFKSGQKNLAQKI